MIVAPFQAYNMHTMTLSSWKNKLYFGDNLDILRDHVDSETVDLIYLDPPFNSNASYNVLFQEKGGENSAAQITAFEDTWHWGMESEYAYQEVVKENPKKLADLLQAMRTFLGQNDMMAYLTMMAQRMVELHRILKSTGSIYLHCDPTASHYLKLLMDAVFDTRNFRNEIIWRRTGSNSAAKRFGPIHQTLLYYVKSDNAIFYPIASPYTKGYIEDYFTETDERGRYRPVLLTGPGTRQGDSGKQWRKYDPTSSGRHWQPSSYLYSKYNHLTGDDLSKYPLLERLDKLDEIGLIQWAKKEGGGVPNYKYYLEDAQGVLLQDIWSYQPGTEGCVYGNPDEGIDQDVKWLSTKDKERLNYPTQKPEGVLERIIKASSNEGDLVLDPFCGCGTTVTVAERLKRRWIGIDITHLAITLMKHRLEDTFHSDLSPYEVIGDPKDLESARALAKESEHEGRYQFEWWALGLVEARPAQDKKKGADKGVDGYINFFDDNTGKAKTVIVQVKSGGVHASYVQALRGAVEREKAPIGVLITLEEPTKPMLQEAAAGGFYEPAYFPGQQYPRLQILTIRELLEGKEAQYPHMAPSATFKRAQRHKRSTEDQRLMI